MLEHKSVVVDECAAPGEHDGAPGCDPFEKAVFQRPLDGGVEIGVIGVGYEIGLTGQRLPFVRDEHSAQHRPGLESRVILDCRINRQETHVVAPGEKIRIGCRRAPPHDRADRFDEPASFSIVKGPLRECIEPEVRVRRRTVWRQRRIEPVHAQAQDRGMAVTLEVRLHGLEVRGKSLRILDAHQHVFEHRHVRDGDPLLVQRVPGLLHGDGEQNGDCQPTDKSSPRAREGEAPKQMDHRSERRYRGPPEITRPSDWVDLNESSEADQPHAPVEPQPLVRITGSIGNTIPALPPSEGERRRSDRQHDHRPTGIPPVPTGQRPTHVVDGDNGEDHDRERRAQDGEVFAPNRALQTTTNRRNRHEHNGGTRDRQREHLMADEEPTWGPCDIGQPGTGHLD